MDYLSVLVVVIYQAILTINYLPIPLVEIYQVIAIIDYPPALAVILHIHVAFLINII